LYYAHFAQHFSRQHFREQTCRRLIGAPSLKVPSWEGCRGGFKRASKNFPFYRQALESSPLQGEARRGMEIIEYLSKPLLGKEGNFSTTRVRCEQG